MQCKIGLAILNPMDARRHKPNPAVHAAALAKIGASAEHIVLLEGQLAEARRRRDAAIIEALTFDIPPTHAQIARAAHLERGGISKYAKRAWSGMPYRPAQT